MVETLDSTLSNQRIEQESFDQLQEAHWLAASQRGDGVAFNRLVLKWEKSIYNLTLRMLQDPEEAAEATQEVFLCAFKSIRGFRHKAKFSTWLYRIASNHCLSRLRRRPPGIQYSLDDTSPESPLSQSLPSRESHEGELLREESHKRVRLALEQLQPEQRVVIELKFFQDLTFEEIAAIAQVPLSTIKSRLYTGLEILKARLARTSLKAARR